MQQPVHFLIVDPQNDFCDLPADWCPVHPLPGEHFAPALPVPGAHADMLRLAGLMRAGVQGISAITVTLDAHHRLDIAHPLFWRSAQGGAVSPFTTITAAQVRQGDYLPQDASAPTLARVLAYLDALERLGRYTLMVWPVHCEIGSWGHNVHAGVKAAYNYWEDTHHALVQKLSKGSNPWTEHYSVMQAEVPDVGDPATQFNSRLLADFERAGSLVIAGEASSHCVRATTEHILDRFAPGIQGKVILLTDCMSPVSGFEAQHQVFLSEMRQRGVRLCTSDELLPELLAQQAVVEPIA